jgi:hypothetical protein
VRYISNSFLCSSGTPYPSPSVTSICSHILTKFNQLKQMISLGLFFRYGDSFQAEAVAACVSAETPWSSLHLWLYGESIP